MHKDKYHQLDKQELQMLLKLNYSYSITGTVHALPLLLERYLKQQLSFGASVAFQLPTITHRPTKAQRSKSIMSGRSASCKTNGILPDAYAAAEPEEQRVQLRDFKKLRTMLGTPAFMAP
uniref:Uncharacterized protein n=1 Tax=Globodera rostochiensis TaxID=31243 RepID=A0A914IG92_GLORO